MSPRVSQQALRRLAALQAAPRWRQSGGEVQPGAVDFDALSRDPTFVRLDGLATCLEPEAGAAREEPVTCGLRKIAAAVQRKAGSCSPGLGCLPAHKNG